MNTLTITDNIIELVMLFFHQVSVNSLDKAGSTPLHWAAHGGHVQCIQMLLAVPNCQVNVQVNTSLKENFDGGIMDHLHISNLIGYDVTCFKKWGHM
jgi:ankyrin repeat protein